METDVSGLVSKQIHLVAKESGVAEQLLVEAFKHLKGALRDSERTTYLSPSGCKRSRTRKSRECDMEIAFAFAGYLSRVAGMTPFFWRDQAKREIDAERIMESL